MATTVKNGSKRSSDIIIIIIIIPIGRGVFRSHEFQGLGQEAKGKKNDVLHDQSLRGETSECVRERESVVLYYK